MSGTATYRRTKMADLDDARLEYAGQLAGRAVQPTTAQAEAMLAVDLIDLFFVLRDAKRAAGKLPPNNYRRDLGAMTDGWYSPVSLARIMVTKQTDGFTAAIEIDRPDLAVEALVADTRKPYHHLFKAQTVALAASRLRAAGFNPGWLA